MQRTGQPRKHHPWRSSSIAIRGSWLAWFDGAASGNGVSKLRRGRRSERAEHAARERAVFPPRPVPLPGRHQRLQEQPLRVLPEWLRPCQPLRRVERLLGRPDGEEASGQTPQHARVQVCQCAPPGVHPGRVDALQVGATVGAIRLCQGRPLVRPLRERQRGGGCGLEGGDIALDREVRVEAVQAVAELDEVTSRPAGLAAQRGPEPVTVLPD